MPSGTMIQLNYSSTGTCCLNAVKIIIIMIKLDAGIYHLFHIYSKIHVGSGLQ